jgi:hypothetical protein
MDCFCGCGTKLPRRLTDANLLASRFALELLAWDKARADGRLGTDAVELESLIGRGENSYQRLLLLLHGEGRETAVAEAETWLAESKAQRAGRRDIEEGGSVPLVSKRRLRLDEEDFKRLDRKHPAQSFNRIDGRLQRLVQLHAEGILSDEELAAAKGRVTGSE